MTASVARAQGGLPYKKQGGRVLVGKFDVIFNPPGFVQVMEILESHGIL